jgi:arylsulfatase A-like enzyme
MRSPRLFLSVAWLTSVLVAVPTNAAERGPNILFILADNLGKDWFGCYGSDEGTTPNIDRLASGGVRFRHCYMTALCSTSRAAIYTGRYGFRTGWHTHHDAAIYGGGGLDWQREITIARVLKNAGYATALTGKWQINDLYEQTDALAQHGFDEHLVWTGALVGEGTADHRWRASVAPGGKRELESRYWDPVVFRNGERLVMSGKFGPDEYLNYLVDFMERHKERPFLACYASPLTHVPPVTTPNSTHADAADREKYIGMVRYLDEQVGRLVAALERLGLRENTIVVFTTDNGSSRHFSGTVGGKVVPGGLGTQTEPGLDTPLIVNCPGRVETSRVSDALVDCSDFFPTFADLAGVSPPAGLTIDGRSFTAELDNLPDTRSARDFVFTQYAGVRVVRDRRYKLYSDGRLFDVAADWLEQSNLASAQSPEAVSARTRLQSVLDRLPQDANLPFAARSQSAFRIQGTKP